MANEKFSFLRPKCYTAGMEEAQEPTFPMRINRYLALRKHATRRGADELIKKKLVFLNGKLAVLGDKVQKSDTVEVRFHGKPTPLIYIAYNKPKGVATHVEQDEKSQPATRAARGKDTKQAAVLKDVFPVGGLDKDSRGLLIFTNDGRVTDRLLSPKYSHEKEYVVKTVQPLRSSFKQKMEAGVKIDNETTEPCKVKILDEDTFRVILGDEKRHQLRRMCVALFQDVKDIQCVRIMNIQLGTLKEGNERRIEGEELQKFLKSLDLLV
jgi:23S rRNA pseudouridine2604 synthase